MIRSFITELALIGIICAETFGTTVDDVQALIDSWLDTNRIISETRRDWASESTLLVQEEKLLQMEVAELELKSARLKKLSQKADLDKEHAISKTQHYKELLSFLEAKVDSLEKNVLAMVPAFPQPLLEQISSYLLTLREQNVDPKRSNTSERLQALVGIISAAEDFNSKLTLTYELRGTKGSESVQVQVLYWGLAGAYAVSPTNEIAQVGFPATNGWLWENRPEFAGQIRKLIAVREGTAEARFVQSPVVLSEVRND